MKKSLIALAAAAAVGGAFAQSSVTISGLVDIGIGQVDGPARAANPSATPPITALNRDQLRVAMNGSATTAIVIAGTEDLGGGLSGLFRYEMNPDFSGGSGVAGPAGANGYNFVGIRSGFGSLLLGRLNTSTLATWGVAQPFGTALGSGYGSAGVYTRYPAQAAYSADFSWPNPTPTTGSQSVSIRPFGTATTPTRFNGSIEYTTPNLAGFTGRALWVPKVDEAGNSANKPGIYDLGLQYAGGPLTVALSYQVHEFGSQTLRADQNPANVATTGSGDNKLMTLAARYALPMGLTLQGGYWTEELELGSTKLASISGYVVGGSYTIGAVTLRASYIVSDVSSSTGNADRSLIGVGADYAFSKRTAVYARYEDRTQKAGTTSRYAAPTSDEKVEFDTKTIHVGIRHTF